MCISKPLRTSDEIARRTGNHQGCVCMCVEWMETQANCVKLLCLEWLLSKLNSIMQQYFKYVWRCWLFLRFLSFPFQFAMATEDVDVVVNDEAIG